MSIRAGQSLLHYRVVEKVGAGGMGEVYRAEDTRLGRDVAIKLLPDALRDDPHRLARLEREARLLASLNHPHVATVHGLEQAEDGARILVMELVQGESLAARLERGALPLQQVYELGAQISEALGAAHARGIVHRDLKPGNIMLTRQGIKLIDFGLAKSLELPSVDAHGATQTLGTRSEALTGEGALVGTFQYMSPEQLEGQEADSRADIFALGAVLYEMATGRKAFHGKSAASLIAAILSAERPSIARDQPLAPPALDRLVRTCLARDPDERWQSARDVGFELNGIAESRTTAEAAAPGAGRHGLGGPIAWAVAAVALLGAVFFAFRPLERPARSAPVVRFPLSLPDGGSSDFERISPDGRHASMSVAAGGRRQIWLRSLDVVSARPLPGTDGAWSHFWSPDSRFIGFFSEGKLKKIDVQGGLPEPLCDAPGSGPAQLGAWGRDGTILFGISEAPGIEDGLYRVSADGGTPAPITLHGESGEEFRFSWPGWPSFLPDGRHFVSLCSWSEDARGICVTSLATGQTHKLLDVESYAEYSPPGYLLYSHRGVLVAHPFDLDAQRVRGEPVPIADGMTHWGGLGLPTFSASQNGVLLHAVGGGESRLVLKDRQGVEVGQVGAPEDYEDFRLAPDGSQVAATIIDPQTGLSDIWLIERARNVTTRFTFGENSDSCCTAWSPDGRSLVFAMARDNPPTLHRKSLGGGEVEELLPSRETLQWPFDWAPDGEIILYGDRDPKTDWDLWALPLAGAREPTPLVRTRFREWGGVFSPDGSWVAYASNETGQSEVYVQRFRGGGEKRRVSTAGGSQPRWPREGGELFYVSADSYLMAVLATSEAGLELGTPVRLFRIETSGGGEYDVTADGQRFLFNAPMPGSSSAPTVVVNWTGDLGQ